MRVGQQAWGKSFVAQGDSLRRQAQRVVGQHIETEAIELTFRN
jgi:hypothetical protein